MATKFVTNLNLNQNQILNGRFEVVASDPGTGNFEGRLIYNSTEKTFKVFDGTAWRDTIHAISASGASSGAITVTETNGSVTIAPNLATSSVAGVMSATDKGKLDAATAEATVSTLVFRDSAGNFKAATPTDSAHVATKGYVDAARSGLDVKDSCRVATTAPINIATDLNNGDTIDGITLVTGDRVLVKNQSTASENGIYVVTATGAGTRASDFNSGTNVTSGAFTFIEQGTTNADSGWVLTTDGTITVGTTALAFAQFSGAGQITAGDGLSKTGNQLDVVKDSRTPNILNGRSIDIVSDEVRIDAQWWGQTSIRILGTVTTGTWNGSTISVQYGGTGLTTITTNGVIYGNGTSPVGVTAAGTEHQVLRAGSGGVPAFGAIALNQSAAVTGNLPLANGGTNASSASGARTQLASDISPEVGVSTPALARVVAKSIGNGSATSFAIVHNFNTRDVVVDVYDATNYDTVIADVVRTDTNTVTVAFSVAPASGAFRVVITG